MAIQFNKPIPFKQALDIARMKTLLPTSMTSEEIALLEAGILERSRFSARVRSAEHLEVLDGGIDDLVSGKIDPATARLRIKQFLARSGYEPDPEIEGGIQDFSSDVRIDLQLRMGVKQAQGYGWWQQSQDAVILDAFPASEFLRVGAREKPRENWKERWNAARAATTAEGATDSASGRMVALKNHPIWSALSRFGTPYEPFDYGSGMGTEDVSRREAIALGIIDRDTIIPPEQRPFNEDLQATPQVRSDTLKTLLNASGAGRFDAGGVFHFAPKKGGA